MIRVHELSKAFGNVRAVDGISFEIARGEVVGLLGPNGAGKTTTMRLITGYLMADGGNVTVDGIPVSESSVDARRRIGYLPENAPLYTDADVVEYLDYIGGLRGIPSRERAGKVRAMVEACALNEVVGRRIGQLSKGFRQRVGLAAAMIHEPPILILDEPTSGLDPNQIAEIRGLIRAIGRERTVVLSTHILQEVEATCSRALIMNAGQLVGAGTIAELKHHCAFRSQYTVTARAPRERIERQATKLSGFAIQRWLSEPDEERQRFVLTSESAGDRSEEIFQWAVSEGFVLSEIGREAASLEQVFQRLTQTP